ncbi:uncharacterized protein MONBRDRAFT_26468 [Monosiga brevicollis MX1]|uniref:TEA domain-containing protein n=1 Tax=Monosiga brevicollis TaxID=81824 RepID=A9V2G2_MONBE|nr:uncharacterized protein MONBRDRAFT_26468 [Monosiga brevicollis MX1]EDQ88370.1 predicted protein [Monosiga brevicollis MX1]|eukprot:XP_001746963.1 hypothetical protein [Monosiga brevicollis MX1]
MDVTANTAMAPGTNTTPVTSSSSAMKAIPLDDGDGIWSPDIEQAFAEALQIYPPCGRRKIILSEEGKMYGRNELIARYIKLKTGKTRSRKQVSSHIQVLARKKQRELQTKLKENPAAAQQLAHTLSGLSSAEIVSSTISPSSRERSETESAHHGRMMTYSGTDSYAQHGASAAQQNAWQSRTYNGIARLRLALDYFHAFVDYPMGAGSHNFVELTGSYHFADPQMECIELSQIADKFPRLHEAYLQGPPEAFFLVKFWVDMTFDPNQTMHAMADTETPGHGINDRSFFGLTCRFESLECMVVEISMCAIQLGKPVVEKIHVEEPIHDQSRYVYAMNRSPLCEYMATFAQRLRALDDIDMMNKVLENFHVTQTVRNQSTGEVLFSFACVFEVAKPGLGCGHHVYKLVDTDDDMFMRRYTT